MGLKVLLLGKRLAGIGAKKEAPMAEAKAPSKAENKSEVKTSKSVDAKPVAKPVEVKASKPTEVKPVKAEAKKKPFYLDVDYLAVVVLLVVVLFGARVYGLEINSPQIVSVTDNAVFTVDLVNNSDSAVGVTLDFFSPVKYSASYPKQLAPNSTGKATITVYNNLNLAQDVSATIEATVGKTKVQKSVILSFKQNELGVLVGAFSILFSPSAFISEISSFGFLEWFGFALLVIIAAILLIAFIARLTRTKKGERK